MPLRVGQEKKKARIDRSGGRMKTYKSDSIRKKYSLWLDQSDIREILRNIFGDNVFDSADWEMKVFPNHAKKGDETGPYFSLEVTVLRNKEDK